MTRKDFERLAYALSMTYRSIDASDTAGLRAHRRAVLDIAAELERHYPAFNRPKFCVACYG